MRAPQNVSTNPLHATKFSGAFAAMRFIKQQGLVAAHAIRISDGSVVVVVGLLDGRRLYYTGQAPTALPDPSTEELERRAEQR